MPKDKKPSRRRKPAAAKIEQPEIESEPVAQPSAEVHPVPRRPEVVIRERPIATTPPVVARVADVIRTVAVALIDIADAAAESLTRQIERRT